MAQGDIFFEVTSKLGKHIRITRSYWHFITTQKHPSVLSYERGAQLALIEPDEIRQSKKDPRVFLYYRKTGNRYFCVVARHNNGDGFVITCYWTSHIKEGERIWPK